MEALRGGRIDAVAGALRGGLAADIDEHDFFDDPYVVVVRSDHPLAGQRRLTARSMQSHSWVLPPAGTPRRETLERLFARLDRRPRIALETNSVAMTIAILAQSDSLALTARSLAQIEFAGADLALIELPYGGKRRSIGVTVRRGWLPTRPQADFLEELRRQCTAAYGAT